MHWPWVSRKQYNRNISDWITALELCHEVLTTHNNEIKDLKAKVEVLSGLNSRMDGMVLEEADFQRRLTEQWKDAGAVANEALRLAKQNAMHIGEVLKDAGDATIWKKVARELAIEHNVGPTYGA